MALSKFNLKVSLTYNGSPLLSTDLSQIKGAILDAATKPGIGLCLKLGDKMRVVATALYVFVKDMAKKWPWAEVTDVERDTIEVTANEEKEEELKALVQKELMKSMADDFENMEGKLEEILGKEYTEHGKTVLELLRDVRVASISHKSANAVVTDIYNEGKHDVKEVGRDVLVADSGKHRGGGVVAAEYNLGEMKGQRIGGNVIVMRGQNADEAERMIRAARGASIRIKILGRVLKNAFEQDFKPGTTIFEVIRALNEAEGEDSNRKVDLKHKTDKGLEEITDTLMTIEKLGKVGDTVLLWAELPGSKND